MKRLAVSLIFIPFAASAQNFGNQHVDKARLQQIMQEAKRAQVCMAEIDKNALEEFKQKSQELNNEIKKLCADGKRNKAAERIKQFKDDALQSKVMTQIKNCTQGMENMMGGTSSSTYLEAKGQHICDKQDAKKAN